MYKQVIRYKGFSDPFIASVKSNYIFDKYVIIFYEKIYRIVP